MSTRPETLGFLLDQLGDWPGVRTRRMFGEYCVYLHDKPVAFVCDDQLYVKPTEAGAALLERPVWGKFYDKAKPHLLLTPDEWDDRARLRALLEATAHALPPPRQKSPKRTPRGAAQPAPKPAQATRAAPPPLAAQAAPARRAAAKRPARKSEP